MIGVVVMVVGDRQSVVIGGSWRWRLVVIVGFWDSGISGRQSVMRVSSGE